MTNHMHTYKSFLNLVKPTGIRLYLPFSIDFEQKGIPFGSKSFRKW